MSVDNSRFSYGRPQWDMDRGELAASSTEVGDQVASKQDLTGLAGVAGYCTARPAADASPSAVVWKQDDAAKGAHFETGLAGPTGFSSGIVIDRPGVWMVNARLSLTLQNNYMYMAMGIRQWATVDGAVVTRNRAGSYAYTGGDRGTVQCSAIFVVRDIGDVIGARVETSGAIPYVMEQVASEITAVCLDSTFGGA